MNDAQVSTEQGEKLAAALQVPFLETSAKTGHNVDVAFTTLVGGCGLGG